MKNLGFVQQKKFIYIFHLGLPVRPHVRLGSMETPPKAAPENPGQSDGQLHPRAIFDLVHRRSPHWTGPPSLSVQQKQIRI